MTFKKIIILLLIISISYCKNYYNEMIEWTDSIPIGTNLDSVKQIQPDYFEIDWKNPETVENQKRYFISKIKNTNDILKMENYLAFIENKYQGRFARK